VAGKVLQFPSRLLGRIQSKASSLNDRLTRQTERYLLQMQQREERLRKKLAAIDSAGVQRLFAGSEARYQALARQLLSDTGGRGQAYSGIYPAYLDSLQGGMRYLKQENIAGAAAANSELQTLQSKLADADEVKTFLQQRKHQIGQYLVQHGLSTGLLGGMNKEIYYYSQQLREYKEMWNDPDKMERQAMTLLNRLPEFQGFMKHHSLLAGLFDLPGSYGTPQGLTGLQTKDQVAALIQGQAGTSGATDGGAGMAALQGKLQSAESQLDSYKSKLSTLGAGNGDVDMPNFKPNDQHTKAFWQRLEYGTDFQTTRTNSYFPTVTDFGLSLGYKLGHNNVIGIGASYKLGWGNGIQHIAVSSQGAGLRSFLQIKIKGSFWATGGLEYNYTTPFTSYQQLKQLQYWTKSGLIGVTKTVSMKNRLLKKTMVSLLWDFLSYQQRPQTQPLLFRIGYVWR